MAIADPPGTELIMGDMFKTHFSARKSLKHHLPLILAGLPSTVLLINMVSLAADGAISRAIMVFITFLFSPLGLQMLHIFNIFLIFSEEICLSMVQNAQCL